jgi:hypothetical protein
MMLCRNLTAAPWVIFTVGMASIHLVNVSTLTNKYLKPPSVLGKMPTMSIPQTVKGQEISIGQRGIGMLRRLLLEELAISAFLYDFHCVIIRRGPVKSMSECFPDDRVS